MIWITTLRQARKMKKFNHWFIQINRLMKLNKVIKKTEKKVNLWQRDSCIQMESMITIVMASMGMKIIEVIILTMPKVGISDKTQVHLIQQIMIMKMLMTKVYL